MAKHSNLLEKVREYQNHWRNASLPSFEVSALYDLRHDWSTGYPLGEKTGCYCFLDAAENILYIGKASANSSLGRRIDSYFVRSASSGEAILKHDGWSVEPRYIVCIAVSAPFEAPSFEEFLIRELSPPDNRQARS